MAEPLKSKHQKVTYKLILELTGLYNKNYSLY